MVRVGKKVWNGEEEVKLSKLVVTFWQRHGCLPHVRAYGFWKTVKDRLPRFSIKQLQRKMSSLRKRHLQILTGNAREVRLHEAETLSIWAKMIGNGNDSEDEDHDVALFVSMDGKAGRDTSNEQKESTDFKGTHGMQMDANEGQASGHQGIGNQGPEGEHAEDGMADVGARGGADKVDSSCCIIEEPDEPEEVEEVEEEEEVEEMEERQQEHGWDEAADCSSSQGNQQHASQHEAALPSDPKQELQLLTCITMNDLASAVRTLAEIVACSHTISV